MVEKRGLSMEARRRKSLLRKGSASASQNFVAFLKQSSKEQDPEKKRASNRLLRNVICKQWYVIALAIPLSFLGTIQDLATSHFIGQTIDAMENSEWKKFDELIFQWVVIIAVGSMFTGIRDYLYGVSSEKIGEDIRSRFFTAVIRKDTGFFDDRKVGDIRKYRLETHMMCD